MAGKSSNVSKIDKILSLQDVINLFEDDEDFLIVGYSLGSIIALKLAKELELRGKKGRLVLIDGSPLLIRQIAKVMAPVPSDEFIQNSILLTCMQLVTPDEYIEQSANVMNKPDWNAKLEAFINVAKKKMIYSEDYGRKMITSLVSNVKLSLNVEKLDFETLDSIPISLFKANLSMIKDIDEDYGLKKYGKLEIDLNVIDGNHYSILSNAQMVDRLNTFA